MRFYRLYALLLVGGVFLLLGPSTALSQRQKGGGKGGQQGDSQPGAPVQFQLQGAQPGGGGAPMVIQMPGGGGMPGGGMGGPGGGRGGGGGAQMFDMLSGGKDFVSADDVAARFGAFDPTVKDKIQQFMQSQGITNGQITRDQFSAYMQQARGNRGQGNGGPRGMLANPQDDDKRAEDSFNRMDTNHNGALTYDQIPDRVPLKDEFAKWDTDQNGVIDLNEYKAYFKARMAMVRSQNITDPSLMPDGGAPGTLQQLPAEQEADKRPTVYHVGNLPKELPPWFEQMDKDRDGQVGLYEWVNAVPPRDLKQFEAIDANGDGFITVEEVLRYQRMVAKENGTAGPGANPFGAMSGMPGIFNGLGNPNGNNGPGGPRGPRGANNGMPGGANVPGAQPDWRQRGNGGNPGGGAPGAGGPGAGGPGGGRGNRGGDPNAAGGNPGGGRGNRGGGGGDPNAAGGNPGGGRGGRGGQPQQYLDPDLDQ